MAAPGSGPPPGERPRGRPSVRRGPLAALLLLLGVMLGPGGAGAAAPDVSGKGSRLGPDRHGAPVQLLRAAQRGASEEDEGERLTGPVALPGRTGVVTFSGTVRPPGTAAEAPVFEHPRPRTAAYRARAPPADR